jgi:hypothetical protein
MSRLASFFLFCAGAEESILKRTPTERNKYAGIGATVFFTGVFAAIAGGYALHTVFDSIPLAVVFGTLWGLMIFNLDRYIVMSLKKKDKIWKEIGMATPRLVLAVLIAFVIAKPLELKLFESEIASELVLKEQEVYKNQEDLLKTRYTSDITQMKTDLDLYNAEIEVLRQKRNELNLLAIREADGTGGSGLRNLGPIYKAKKKDADLAQQELDSKMANLAPLMEIKKAQITNAEEMMAASLASMKKTKLSGFAARLDALGNLSKKSRTIFWASIFITLLFIAIETAPLFVKLISERSPYDYRLNQHEVLVAQAHNMYVDKLVSETNAERAYAKEVNRYQSLQAIGAEKELIKKVIETEVDKIKEEALSWQEYRAEGRRFG